MSIVVNIISAVIKSVVGDKIRNELVNEVIGISIDGISEQGIDKINGFINREKANIEHILSKENMKSLNIPEKNIDYVTAEIKDLLLKVKITDEVLGQCGYDSMNLCALLWNEYCKCKNNYVECESDIKKGLFTVSEALIKLVRESKDFEKEVLTHIRKSVDDTNVELQRIYEYMKKNYDKLNDTGQIALNILLMILEQIQKRDMLEDDPQDTANQDKKFQNDKKQEYIANWNSRLFLHVDDEENPITLADAFIMPDYKMIKSVSRIGFSKKDTLDKIIEKFINYNKSSTMLITGVPGIGKSSITSWIANKYKDDQRVIILRFRDWKREKLRNGLLNAICDVLPCRNEDLETKILVLDGFDEIKALDICQTLLNKFINEMKDFYNFKCIITSRPAYIDCEAFQNILELKEFDIDRVESFCKIITKDSLYKRERIESNLEVLGIPVILYMAIMSNVDIGKNPSKPELYNRIFADQGGIFDKFYDDGTEYDRGDQILRNSENIKMYLDFLRKVAFKMFEAGGAALPQSNFLVPQLKDTEYSISIMDFPIKHLFENTKLTIEFIHSSIYEYFAAEYIYNLMYEKIIINTSGKALEETMGDLFKSNILSFEILDFLRFRIKNSDLNKEPGIVKKAFDRMLKSGMTFYFEQHTRNIVEYELRIFANMLEIVHLWDSNIWEFDESILSYIRINNKYMLNLLKVKIKKATDIDLAGVYLEKANLGNINLERTNLERANLKEANLTKANLKQANLERADLSYIKGLSKKRKGANLFNANLEEANLCNASLLKANLFRANLKQAILYKADLRGADLRGADLYKTKLRGTDLRETNLQGADLRGTDLQEADLRGADLNNVIIDENQVKYLNRRDDLQGVKIYIGKTMKCIRYEEYLKRKQ